MTTTKAPKKRSSRVEVTYEGETWIIELHANGTLELHRKRFRSGVQYTADKLINASKRIDQGLLFLP